MNSKKKSDLYVLTGRSTSMTFGLPDSDETFTMERGVPIEVPDAFLERVKEADDIIFPEGEVPEDAITGAAPQPPEAHEPPPTPDPDASTPTSPEAVAAAEAAEAESQSGEPSPDQA